MSILTDPSYTDLRQSAIDEGSQADGTMETCEFSSKSPDREKRQLSQDDGEDTGTSYGSQNSLDERHTDLSRLGIIPRRAMKNKIADHESILTNLKLILCVPIESTCQTGIWMSHKLLRYYNNSDTEYKRACSTFNREIQPLEYAELLKIHLATKGVYFARNTTQHYYEPQESCDHIEALLLHQYKTPEDVKAFINRLWNICEKKIPKKNTIFIHGAASSGKSWFADCISAFYLSIGHIKNFVRGQNFPFNDCVCRRILLWNEPSIMGSAYDTVKMICAGDPCPCAVKYEGDGKITRTPVIFTSNKLVFPPADPVWNSRIYFEPRWQPAPFLADLDLYPHPLAWHLLIQKYID